MIGIAFGNGSSVDLLPERFWKETLSGKLVGICNMAAFLAPLAENIIQPDVYVAIDPIDSSRGIMIKGLAQRGWLGKIDLWLTKDSNKLIKRPFKIVDDIVCLNSGQALAATLHDKYGCEEVWLVGHDLSGPYMRPLKGWEYLNYKDKRKYVWDKHYMLKPNLEKWKLLSKSRMQFCRLKIWPVDGILHREAGIEPLVF